MYRCDCGFERSLKWNPLAPIRYADCPECGTELGQSEIYATDSGLCRVCGEPANGKRKVYCSERCSDIANAVQRMFTWTSVREQILDRDGWTCQGCGVDVSEDAPADPEVDHIQPISEDGHPFDERNLVTLCRGCHVEKTHGGGEPGRDGVTLGEYLETEWA